MLSFVCDMFCQSTPILPGSQLEYNLSHAVSHASASAVVVAYMTYMRTCMAALDRVSALHPTAAAIFMRVGTDMDRCVDFLVKLFRILCTKSSEQYEEYRIQSIASAKRYAITLSVGVCLPFTSRN